MQTNDLEMRNKNLRHFTPDLTFVEVSSVVQCFSEYKILDALEIKVYNSFPYIL